MLRHTALIAAALMVGATAVVNTNAGRTPAPEAMVEGASAQDVIRLGGGVAVHACRDVDESGPYNIVEFGWSAAGDASGVRVIVGPQPAGECAHLVVFTQPGPLQAS